MPDEIDGPHLHNYLHTEPTLSNVYRELLKFAHARWLESWKRKMLFSDRIPETEIRTHWVKRVRL